MNNKYIYKTLLLCCECSSHFCLLLQLSDQKKKNKLHTQIYHYPAWQEFTYRQRVFSYFCHTSKAISLCSPNFCTARMQRPKPFFHRECLQMQVYVSESYTKQQPQNTLIMISTRSFGSAKWIPPSGHWAYAVIRQQMSTSLGSVNS